MKSTIAKRVGQITPMIHAKNYSMARKKFAGRYIRGKIFSREDIFARGNFREKIFSREDIFA